MLSQFTCTTAFAIDQRRALVADTSPLASAGMSENPLPIVARNSSFLFGGKFLDYVNESLSVQKTADEVASRCKKSRKNVRGSARRFKGSFAAHFVHSGVSMVGTFQEVAVPAPAAGDSEELTRTPLAPKTKHLKTNDYVPKEEQTSPLKIGGRLNLFVQYWQEITDDAFVLSVIRNGCQISVLE